MANEIESRTHKLLVFVGDEKVTLEGRDFKKLSEVIVNEYLSQSHPNYRNFLTDILTKVIRGIPLKTHFYVGLTVTISKNYQDLASKILQSVLASLQNDINSGQYEQVLNTLNYFSQCMNISYLNSLNYMNMLQDLLQAAEREQDASTKKALILTLTKALPFFADSLCQKTPSEFKKFMEKLGRQVDNDELFDYVNGMYQKGEMQSYSSMGRLFYEFGQIQQNNGKLRLNLQPKPPQDKEMLNSNDLYRWQGLQQKDQDYRKGAGLITRMWVEQLITTFSSTSATLVSKFFNLVKYLVSEPQEISFIVESLLLRGLRVKNSMAESYLLLALRNSDDLPAQSKAVEEALFYFFNMAQKFDLSMLVSFSKIFSFIVNNSRADFELTRLIENQDMFLKRSALLRLILQKLSLLNDKFNCPKELATYENSKPVTSEEQYTNSSDKQIFQGFQEALANKSNAEVMSAMIKGQREYEIFLEALFRKTCLSHTHLTILSERYSTILGKYSEWDWDLINKIRNFFRNSFFHRLLYFRFMISKKYLSFASYINYVGGLTGKSDLEMLWIKIELNQLNNEFGKSLKNK